MSARLKTVQYGNELAKQVSESNYKYRKTMNRNLNCKKRITFSARKAEAGALPPQGLVFPLNAKVLHMSKTSVKYLNPDKIE